MRIGFWNTELQRKGPGLLARDLEIGGEAGIADARAQIDALAADILVLGGFDFDAGGLALSALNRGLEEPYPHLLALRSNAGIPSGFDLDGNGRRDEARDAFGFGSFPGQGAMAILSRYPFDPEASRDFTGFLWRDLPGGDLPPLPEGAVELLPLSTTGHHDTAVILPDGQRLHLLTWHATTPAFDGSEDRNGKRNADETRFWTLLLGGALPYSPPETPFVLIGQANSDPEKGDGNPEPIRALLGDPRLHSPLPGDTVDYGGKIGPLRVAYILPSAGLRVTGHGRQPAKPGARHQPIWVEIDF